MNVFCPRCHAEYIVGVTRCYDCDVDLVEELPLPEKPAKRRPVAMPSPDWATDTPGDLVTMLRSGDRGLIAMAQSLLQSADIPSLVLDDVLQYAVITGPSELKVRPEDVAEAREILEQLRAGP